ncbi:MAG: replication-associated recombination protein A [Desulfobacterales bacterium]
MDLFELSAKKEMEGEAPLAERMRPERLEAVVGHDRAVGEGSLLRSAVRSDRLFSMILWGPPGCGKTTIARIIAGTTRSRFVAFSAVLSGVKDIRAVIETAEQERRFHRRRTILFVDEIHRFNKAQQDAFLHHVESGLITLIGATTENPSFEVIPALLSRCRVIPLEALRPVDIEVILERALKDSKSGLGDLEKRIDADGLKFLAEAADGDARTALNLLERLAAHLAEPSGDLNLQPGRPLSVETLGRLIQKKSLRYDKSGDEHYHLISALHKSLRDSDPDASLYWMARMLAAGEEPLYIGRRMVRFASEDVGNADPHALTVALNAVEAFRFLGAPEGELALAQAAVYLATAPKSNAVYVAFQRASEQSRLHGSLPVPVHLRNAPTRLMKELGFGKDYRYAHDYDGGVVAQRHLPDGLDRVRFYEPTDRGYEARIKNRLAQWRSMMRNQSRE